jgi:DNA topoisomerase III
MILCIAEKPSVARDIASILGANQKKDGYFEGNGYAVSWTIGHLCTLKEPHDYNPNHKSWSLYDLPLIPDKFGIKLIENPGQMRQFKVIEQLVSLCTEVINCGDAGQEGELIQRWVLHLAKCNKPIKRLWISSLTDEAIKDGFQNLKLASDYNRLYAAGNARAVGDWLLGINATRLYTMKFGQSKQVLSIGRVQTPTLNIIVTRHKEIEAFNSAEFFELHTIYRGVDFSFAQGRIDKEDRAKKGLEVITGQPFTVTNFDQKEGKEGNPKLFDLTSLQVEANRKHGYTSEDTLNLVQNLYEKKVVSYPRVDTNYLTDDLHPKIPKILEGLLHFKSLTKPLIGQTIPKLKSVFDNSKVTDHHAIIPTGIAPSGISQGEQHIYILISKRFIAAFYPECKVSNTTVLGEVKSINSNSKIAFKATGRQVLDPGWRAVYYDDKIEKSESPVEQSMPIFVEGESGPHQPRVDRKKTSAPKPHTEATLLKAMEAAGRNIEDEELREALKSNGIGRPSTRANIIETLFKRKYIVRKGKSIFATDTGVQLIDTIDNELIKSPELTGQWESKLRQIEKGEYDPETFKTELISMLRQITDEVMFNQSVKRIAVAAETQPLPDKKPSIQRVKKITEKISIENLLCPKCKSGKFMKGKSAYGCSNYAKGCKVIVPFEIMSKKLTDAQIIDLISSGKTKKIKGLKYPGQQASKEGILEMTEDFNIGFVE